MPYILKALTKSIKYDKIRINTQKEKDVLLNEEIKI